MKQRVRVLQIILATMGALLFFWWPVSHWLYPARYHELLGFGNPAQFADNALVKVIGTAGMFPVLLLFYAAAAPLRNRDLVKVLIANALFGSLSTVYLISNGQFPVQEYLNACLYFIAAIVLSILYPWKQTQQEFSHVQ